MWHHSLAPKTLVIPNSSRRLQAKAQNSGMMVVTNFFNQTLCVSMISKTEEDGTGASIHGIRLLKTMAKHPEPFFNHAILVYAADKFCSLALGLKNKGQEFSWTAILYFCFLRTSKTSYFIYSTALCTYGLGHLYNLGVHIMSSWFVQHLSSMNYFRKQLVLNKFQDNSNILNCNMLAYCKVFIQLKYLFIKT